MAKDEKQLHDDEVCGKPLGTSLEDVADPKPTSSTAQTSLNTGNSRSSGTVEGLGSVTRKDEEEKDHFGDGFGEDDDAT